MNQPSVPQITTPPGTLQLLMTTPHRALFSAGVVAACALMIWWAWALTWPGAQTVPPVMIHALVMPLGVFPLFMWGFLFTAGPRWLGVNGPTHLLALALAYLLGLALLVLGAAGWAGAPASALMAPTGLSLMALSWAWVLWQWLRCIRQSQSADRWHAFSLLGAMSLGLTGVVLMLIWVLQPDPRWWLASRHVLMWGFLLPMFLTVSHRMVPFFTQSSLPTVTAWRPYPLLAGWLLGCALMALSQGLEWRWLQVIVATLMAASLGYTSWRWGLLASLSNRLLAMLHLSFAWFGIGMALQAFTSAGWLIGSGATHALALGGCFTMLMGFVTRVTMGHSGRALAADGTYWAVYLALHLVALSRVLAAVVPLEGHWLSLIAVSWGLVLLAWSARVTPIYLLPRSDGKPG
jgi:uncharacterized protein involved in response to NO